MMDRLRTAQQQQTPQKQQVPDDPPVTEKHVEEAHQDYVAAAEQLRREHEERRLREKKPLDYDGSQASPTVPSGTSPEQQPSLKEEDFGYVHKANAMMSDPEEQLKHALKQQQQQSASSRVPRGREVPFVPASTATTDHGPRSRRADVRNRPRTTVIGSMGFGAPDGDDQTARIYNGERRSGPDDPAAPGGGGAASRNAAARMRTSTSSSSSRSSHREATYAPEPSTAAASQPPVPGPPGQEFVQEDIMGVQYHEPSVGYGAPDLDRSARINDAGRATRIQAVPYQAPRHTHQKTTPPRSHHQEYHRQQHNRVYRKLRKQAGSSSSSAARTRSATTTTSADYHRQHQTVNHDTYSQAPRPYSPEQARREHRMPPGHQRRHQRIDSENHSFANHKPPAPAESQKIYQANDTKNRKRPPVRPRRESTATTTAPSALNDPSFNLANINQYADYQGEESNDHTNDHQRPVRARDYGLEDEDDPQSLGEDAAALRSRHGHLNTDISFNMSQFNN